MSVSTHGTIFTAWSVRAIAAGTKTQTRRLDNGRKPYRVGDVLWVKETWGLHACGDETDWCRRSVRGVPADALLAQYCLALRADWGPLQEGCFWRPAIYMPRWASRYALEVTQVRRQALEEISEDDARAEGCSGRDAEPVAEGGTIYAWHGRSSTPCPRAHFLTLWDSLHRKRAPWASNPTVYAYTFQVKP